MKSTRQMPEPGDGFIDLLPAQGVPLSAAGRRPHRPMGQNHLTHSTLTQSVTAVKEGPASCCDY